MSKAPMPCPVCQKPRGGAAPAAAPFCSPRCKDVDLYRWLGGGYAIAGEPVYADPFAGEGVLGSEYEEILPH